MIKLYKYISSLLIVFFFCAQALRAQTCDFYCLRPAAFADREDALAGADSNKWDRTRVDSYIKELENSGHEFSSALMAALGLLTFAETDCGFSNRPEAERFKAILDIAQDNIVHWPQIYYPAHITPVVADNMGRELTSRANAIMQNFKELAAATDELTGAMRKENKNGLNNLANQIIEEIKFANSRITGFVKIERLDTYGNPVLLDPNKSIDGILHHFRLISKTRDLLEINFKKQDDLPPVLIDPNLAISVWSNIIRNASNAAESPKGKQIRVADNRKKVPLNISTAQKEGWVLIEFDDEGPGVDTENADKIFDKGFTTSQNKKGHGIGLALLREIVKRAGGSISFEPNYPHGAKFIVQLPARQPPPAAVAPLTVLNEGAASCV